MSSDIFITKHQVVQNLRKMLIYRRFTLIFCIILVKTSFISAQSDSIPQNSVKLYRLGISELHAKLQTVPDYLSLLEVSSASKITQNQTDAPNVINVFTRKDWLRYGLISFNDLLYIQPSFFPAQDYDRRTVGFRGMFEGWNNNTLLMLVDGIPFNGGIHGTAFSWEITPLFFTKSIEIIRGAGGALYGSNAMNGVLSMNTLEVADLENSIGEIRFRIGSKNTQLLDFLIGTENKHFGLIGAFSYFQTDGLDYKTFDDSERTDSQGFPKKFRINDQRQNVGFFNKIYGKGKFSGLSLQFHIQKWEFGTGQGWLFQIPDQPEHMQQNRHLFAIQYNPLRKNKKFKYEVSFRYQREGLNHNTRYFPNGAFDNQYPHGVTEYLKTHTFDIFLRLQANYQTQYGHLLAGFERHQFIYNGDEAHTANIDLEDTFKPFPENEFRSIRPWFEYIDKQPVRNWSWFFQYVSPKFRDKIQLTISGRYDYQRINYQDIEAVNFTKRRKVFNLVTPRVALVFHPTERWTFKALVGRAFRTPAPSELFGSNTFSLASNIKELKPELVTNYDLNTEFRWSKHITIRTNFYAVNFKNKIGYSTSNANLSTNIYTLLTTGLEAEIYFRYKNWQSFFNYTYARRVDEKIMDKTITEDKTTVTFVPAHLANIGTQFEYKAFFVTLLGHIHGVQKRKETDFFEQSDLFRPDELPAWINVDLQIGYLWKRWLEVRLLTKNALNTSQYLLKTNAYLFDYQRENRIVQTEVRIRF